MELLDEMGGVVKKGLINGPTLYLTQKLVASSDIAAGRAFGPGFNESLRTPLVGLALATLPVALSNHWMAEKASEYIMANAVAQTLTRIGRTPAANGAVPPNGPLDQQINSLFMPIANLGAPAAPPAGGGGAGGMGAYISRRMRGYMTRPPMAGIRSNNLRGGMGGYVTDMRGRNSNRLM